MKVIIDHFSKYPLITQKCYDFKLFEKAVHLVELKEHLTYDGLRKIVAIKASMNLGLSDVLKKAFPDVVKVNKPLPSPTWIIDRVEGGRCTVSPKCDTPKPIIGVGTSHDGASLDPHWIAGFTSAEGSFMVLIQASETHSIGFIVRLELNISQHFRDEQLIRSLIKYFECGTIQKNGENFDFRVTKIRDIIQKIIPFFQKYSILGVKALDFAD